MEFIIIILSLSLVSISQGSSSIVRPHGPRPLDPEIIRWLEEKANNHETDINNDIEEILEVSEETTKEDYDMDNEIDPRSMKNTSTAIEMALGSSLMVRPHGPRPSSPEIVQWLEDKAKPHESDITDDIEEMLEVSDETKINPRSMKNTSATIEMALENLFEEGILQFYNSTLLHTTKEDNKLAKDVDTQALTNSSVILEVNSEDQYDEGSLFRNNQTSQGHDNIDRSDEELMWSDEEVILHPTEDTLTVLDATKDKLTVLDAAEDTLTVLDTASMDRSEADIKRLSKTVGTLVVLSFSLGYFV